MDQKTLRERAIELSKISYTTELFKDKTTDGETVYLAVHPELEECMAQGDTPDEAIENLNEVRIDYFEHLLEFHLPIPSPRITETKDTSSVSAIKRVVTNIAFPGFEGYLPPASQPNNQPERILSVAPSP
ncbi:MAG TPA: type II toxin-antitoxin system HicB family antitoxin [Anaerolineales bacterium]